MSLDNFLNLSDDYTEKISRLNKLKQRFIQEGIPAQISQYKAEEIVFTPENLEKIKLNSQENAGMRPSLNFFFDNETDIKLVSKYFNTSMSQMAVKNSSLLLEILRMLEELKWGYNGRGYKNR